MSEATMTVVGLCSAQWQLGFRQDDARGGAWRGSFSLPSYHVWMQLSQFSHVWSGQPHSGEGGV